MLQPTRLISTPFAQEGEKTEIQNVTGEFDNSATYQLGFPPLTMQSIRLGGKPPKGTDFNGVLFDITENISFLCKGGRYQYNAGLSTLIGGYPEGSNLLLDDNVTEVVSTVAGNQNNPNINMTGWILKPNKTTAVNVADASGETQQQVNYNGGAKWHSRAGGYLENERVVLANGDIVKSTIGGNENDPNVNMTGWVNESNAVKNRIVWFEDFVSDATGATDVTAEMQSLLDSHDGDIYAKNDSVFKTTNTLFNRKNNRIIDFHNAKIVNKSNSRYAIVTISPAFTGSTDAELNTFCTERHYEEEIEASHIKNLKYEMSSNLSSGMNLGVGIVYGYRCYISNAEPLMTNGNGAEIRNSLACGVYKSKLFDHRSYSAFLFMSENCVVLGNEIAGGIDGVVVKMNRDGNPDVNHIITQNTFTDVGTSGYAISGGAVKESSTNPIYVANHQIVRGVKIYDNIFEGSALIPKIGAHIYSENWEIYGNTFKCGGLAGTVIGLGSEGVPTVGEILKGGHQVYGNFFYDVNSIGNPLVASALNSKVFNNFMFNVKSRYMFYALKDRNNNPLDYADFYGNTFDKDCAVYCGDTVTHGLAVGTQDVKNFRCYSNTGYIKAISASEGKVFTSIYSAAKNTELYSNDITYSAAADITTLIAQSIAGAGNLKRIDNQTITIDTTGASALSTVYGVNTTPTIKVTGKHTGNTYKLIGSATVSRAFVAGASMVDDITNVYDGLWSNQILNNSGRPLQQTNIEVQSSAMPTSGNYKKGDYIRNTNPSISANTVIIGWLRITTGSNHVLNTDWVEIKQSTV